MKEGPPASLWTCHYKGTGPAWQGLQNEVKRQHLPRTGRASIAIQTEFIWRPCHKDLSLLSLGDLKVDHILGQWQLGAVAMHYLTITSINDSQENCLAAALRPNVKCWNVFQCCFTKSLHITAMLVVNTRHHICYQRPFLPPTYNKASNVWTRVGPAL